MGWPLVSRLYIVLTLPDYTNDTILLIICFVRRAHVVSIHKAVLPDMCRKITWRIRHELLTDARAPCSSRVYIVLR